MRRDYATCVEIMKQSLALSQKKFTPGVKTYFKIILNGCGEVCGMDQFSMCLLCKFSCVFRQFPMYYLRHICFCSYCVFRSISCVYFGYFCVNFSQFPMNLLGAFFGGSVGQFPMNIMS